MSFSRHIPVQLQASTDTEYGHQSQRVHSWAFAVNSSQDHWPQRTTNQFLSLLIIFFLSYSLKLMESKISSFLSLTAFAQHDVFEIHAFCCLYIHSAPSCTVQSCPCVCVLLLMSMLQIKLLWKFMFRYFCEHMFSFLQVNYKCWIAKPCHKYMFNLLRNRQTVFPGWFAPFYISSSIVRKPQVFWL